MNTNAWVDCAFVVSQIIPLYFGAVGSLLALDRYRAAVLLGAYGCTAVAVEFGLALVGSLA